MLILSLLLIAPLEVQPLMWECAGLYILDWTKVPYCSPEVEYPRKSHR